MELFDDFLAFLATKKKDWFWYLQTTLLSIVEELAGGGSVAVAVDISEM